MEMNQIYQYNPQIEVEPEEEENVLKELENVPTNHTLYINNINERVRLEDLKEAL
jgi:hypothetical protein